MSRDPGLDLPEVLRSYLPAFMSLGTGLGIALHSLLYRCPMLSLDQPDLLLFQLGLKDAGQAVAQPDLELCQPVDHCLLQ